MAPIPPEDNCPVCQSTLSEITDGSEGAKESHVQTCIESHLSVPPTHPALTTKSETAKTPLRTSKIFQNPQMRESEDEAESCPICHTSYLTDNFDGNDAAREAHFADCFESQSPGSKFAPPPGSPPSYNNKAMFPKAVFPSAKEVAPKSGPTPSTSAAMPAPPPAPTDTPSGGFRRLSIFGLGGGKSKEEKIEQKVTKADGLMRQRWGPPGSPTSEMVRRYWMATRMEQHWEYLRGQHPRQFKKYLDKGYMEPIPTSWVQNRQLAYLYPEPSNWETPAEKRLYYLLNNGVMPDGSMHPIMRPLNINRDMYTIIRRGNERNARQVHLDAQRLAEYQSPGDVFQSDKQIKSHRYSDQVPNTVYEARTAALHVLAEGLLHGTDHLETMLLIDVSGSMTWNPHGGMVGPDGIRRFHDQPSNIRLVEHLVHRVLHHMIPRQQKEHPDQLGIDTVTFSTFGRYVGQISAKRFTPDWKRQVKLGGGTQVMQGWQTVKATYFKHQHENYGHGTWDPVFGWQATPEMPKLSLLVFLDGEATDMDEFELELLGETWAYVTIVLVGMENCPHHHSHAIELERVAKFNPHVGFFDVHGRVCERMVVEDILSSVYPVDPPAYSEILKPEYDLPPEELPKYSAW
ncbi:MAG: hypothetical protein ASARMPRED_007488 [Alectoria sarmentosa]|nr:MAG: hypothetical protein ASARMPRED_007488 [Alectoria sarmentosa]